MTSNQRLYETMGHKYVNSWRRWKGIMKAVPFEEKRLAKWSPPYIVQPKYDGDRCKGYPIEGSPTINSSYILLTSEENPYFSIPHIQESLINSNLNIILDGEIYNHQVFLEGGHELVHSMSSRKVNIHPRHKELEFHLFDLEISEPQAERLLQLEKIKQLNLPYIKVAPYWICETLDDIKKVYDKLVNNLLYEGIIIRHMFNRYEEKRSTWVMKFKPKCKDTYDIIGWKEEVSKNGIPKGRIGSIVCSSQKGDEFAVSAGLDDNDRTRLWIRRNELAGKQIIVHYQHLTNKKIPKGTFDIEVIL